MSTNFKKPIGMFGFTPENTQGSPNWDVDQLNPAPGSKVSITIDTATGGGAHDTNLSGAADDLLNGLIAYCVSGANAGEAKAITDFTEAGGVATITTEAFTNDITAGDQFYLFAPLQASNIKVTPKTEDLKREDWQRWTYDPPPSLKGFKTVSGSFDFELPGLVQENGNGDTPTYDRFSQLVRGIGTRRSIAGQLVSGVASTTTSVDVVSAAAWADDDALLVTLDDGNEVGIITDVDTAAVPDNVTVTPPLTTAPEDGAEVFQGERITPDEEDHMSFTFLFIQDDQLVECRGCIINMTVSGTYGQAVKASIEFDGEDWDMADSITIDGPQIKTPVEFDAGRCYFGTHVAEINSFEFTFGHERVMLADTGVGHRWFVTKRKATCKVVLRDKNVTLKESWEALGTQAKLVVQVGDTAGAALAIYGNAQIQDPAEFTKVEDHVYWDVTFVFVDAQYYYSAPYKPRLARF